MRTKGKITTWNDAKAFGFITPLGGGKQLFVHISAFKNRGRRPQVGEVVTYAESKNRQGRPCAVNATLAGDLLHKKEQSRSSAVSVSIALVYLLTVGVVVLADRVPPHVLAIYFLVSAVTFAAYASDKSAARSGAWRTSESTLHMLSLAGGWPGALVAQQKLRHKSRKQEFRVVFWATVLVNCSVFGWLTTPSGGKVVETLIARII